MMMSDMSDTSDTSDTSDIIALPKKKELLRTCNNSF